MPRPIKRVDDKARPPPVMAAPIRPLTMMHQPPPPAPAGMMPVPPVPAGAPVPPRVVDNDSFLRVRDSAVNRLATISELLRSFMADYIRQTNLLMGEPTAETGHADLLTSFDATATQMMPLNDLVAPVEEKERKKRTHDPNAPKRPLTPYFLYMQHARSIIANDLGPEAPKGAVQEEGQRRWAHMGPTEKKGWNAAYQYNLRLYNARVHSYKSGNPLARNMSDEEALKYADDFQIPMPDVKDAPPDLDAPHDHEAVIAQQLQQAATEVAPTPAPASAKKSTASRKRRTGSPGLVETPVPVTAAPHAGIPPALDQSKATPASPDKKRRRASAKNAEDKEEPKKSSRKKTKNA